MAAARTLSSKPSQHVVIVGGVAGGASTAARLRRLDENARITMFERGPFVSFANCGLPYYIGDVIAEERKLVIVTPEELKETLNLDVFANHTVTGVNRESKTVTVAPAQGEPFEVSYDKLVLATGARPIVPPIPGVDLPGVLTLRTIPDSRRIKAWITEHQAKRAVVIGAGFVGLEMTENLHRLGMEVTVVELGHQLLPSVDAEMTVPLAARFKLEDIKLKLGQKATRIDQAGDSLKVTLDTDETVGADIVIVAAGIRPDNELASGCNLELSDRGYVVVDDFMRTNDPNIYAAGDVVETKSSLDGHHTHLALAGPANRQGRTIAEHIAGLERPFRGVQGTAVCGVFGLTAASTGKTLKTLLHEGRSMDSLIVTYIHPDQHVGYFPGGKMMHVKVIADKETGKILGAQAVGHDGVARRVDSISMAMQFGATGRDISQAELCYAPAYGAAKDPVNMAGMVVDNVMCGLLELSDWSLIASAEQMGIPESVHAAQRARELERPSIVLDVRQPAELEDDPSSPYCPVHVLNVPQEELRARLDELPRDKHLHLLCLRGQRAYYAYRLLKHHGFSCSVLSGGIIALHLFLGHNWYSQPAGW